MYPSQNRRGFVYATLITQTRATSGSGNCGVSKDTMKKLLIFLSLIFSLDVSACALQTYYWPIPMGYKERAVDFDGLLRRQESWDAKSDKTFNLNSSMENVRTNIVNIIKHYEYINFFPEHAKGLKLKELNLISFRVEPAGGNSFLSEGTLEGVIGYYFPEVELSYEKLEKIWLTVLEYELVLAWPNDKASFSYKIEVPTLPDGTILYEYPGMGYCSE